MIYLFGIGNQVSSIIDGSSLTEEQKNKATLILEQLPEPQLLEDHFSILYIDEITKEFSYKYIKKDKVTLQREKLQKLVDENKITESEMEDLLNI